MIEIDSGNAAEFLKGRGLVGNNELISVRELGGGVSNVVLRVSRREGDFVVKQSRPQLRTQAAWFSSLDRVFREIEMLRVLAPLLPDGVVPGILFENRENYLFAMEAAPADHVVWKRELLDGHADAGIAATLAEHLAAVHRSTAGAAGLASLLGDRQVFDQLRLDPYYRHIAAARPRLRPALAALIDQTVTTSLCVVLADFSPKNVLVTRRPDAPQASIMLVDFETGHYGDPAFDLGFFLTHLLLKAIYHGLRGEEFVNLATVFWERYAESLSAAARSPIDFRALEERSIQHVAACVLARIDGKSPVDYLVRDGDRERARRFGEGILLEPPDTMADVFAALPAGIR